MDRIGKYQLLKLIGKGESGTVYLAQDTFTGAQAALKLLDPAVVRKAGGELDGRRQFMNEASLAGKLRHPHIVAIHEASVTDELSYIALEYVPGGNLSQYSAPGSLLSPEDLTQIAFKASGALDYAFRQGIVHRDIKPANLLLVSGTNVKVGDFGAAFQSKLPDTSSAMVGTPFYMSPEQTRGETLGHHSDMFSLGVVLYQLFTGRRPFDGHTLADLFAAIRTDSPLPPSLHRPELSPELDQIILRMLEKLPQDRYPAWVDVALDFARVGQFSLYMRKIPDSEKFVALRKVKMLSHLSEGELWEMVQAGTWTMHPPNTVIMREGEAGSSLFLIGSGEVKVVKQGRLLDVLAAGECVGEMAFIKQGEFLRQATVETMADALLVEIKHQDLEQASLRCRYQLSLALLHSLVDRLAMADQRLVRAG